MGITLDKMEDCIFCKIVKGEIPSYKIYEDDDTFAFLSSIPAVNGHTLVVPKKHFENLDDVTGEILEKIILGIKNVSSLLKNNFGASGINIFNNSGKDAGQEVFHIHFHVIPRFKSDGIDFDFIGESKLSENFEEIAKKIRGSN